jgi:hypothetical protein
MKNKTISAFAIGIAAILSSGLTASADIITSVEYGGHTYELWSDHGSSWEDAKVAAENAGGYLAVLSTTDEIQNVYNLLINNDFFKNNTQSQDIQAWLGAKPTVGNSTTSPFNWSWVTGEAWTSEAAGNFAVGEPNGDSAGLAINRFGSFAFNDEGGHTGGYIVEKGPVPSHDVPDGGTTAALLGMALTGFAAVRRKFGV